jgi:shikimate kinase
MTVSAPREAGARASRVIELVGVAAAGKSTLLRALAARSGRVAAGVPLPRHLQLRCGAAHLARLLPSWLGRSARGRFLSREELRGMGYVDGWWQELARGHQQDALTVLDHGPVFRLTRLRVFGPPLVASAAFRAWHERAVARWAALLDAVVWLDAPDDTLLERIETRSQRHLVKGAVDEEQRRFLERYRAGYEEILAELARAGGPARLRFDTSRASADEIAERLLAALAGSGP